MDSQDQKSLDKYNRIMNQLTARDSYHRLSRMVNLEFVGQSEKPFYCDVKLEERAATNAMCKAQDAALAICGHTAFNKPRAMLDAYLPLHTPEAIAALDRFLSNFETRS